MKRYTLPIIINALLVGSLMANSYATPSEAEFAKQVLSRDTNKAITKQVLTVSTYIAELPTPELKAQALKQINQALLTLDHQAEVADQFIERIGRLAKKGELANLVKQERVQAFAQFVLDDSSTSLKALSDNDLRRLIATSKEGLSEVSQPFLKVMNDVDAVISKTGKAPQDLLAQLNETLKQLPPSRVQAARQLLQNQLQGGWKTVREHIGTSVDGAFILWDAYNITALEDPEEKAAKAVGVATGYGLETAGGLAITALGGGFLHGLVLSWSAAKVSELMTEVIMLQADRENAAKKEAWAGIELRMSVIKGLLRVDDLVKAGEMRKADEYLAKVRQFYFKHSMPTDGLYEKMQDLEQHIDKASHLKAANQVIAQARVPYQQAYQLLKQGRLLRQAKVYAEEASSILQNELSTYPELQTPLTKVIQLLVLIDKVLNNAPPLGQATLKGADQVLAGEYATFTVELSGGIPDYEPVELVGTGLPTGAIVYWQAPKQVGKTTVEVTLKDNLGQTARAQKTVEVINSDGTTPAISKEGQLTLRGFYRTLDSAGYLNREVEAYEAHVGDDVHYIANIENPNYQYSWSVNGKVDPQPDLKHVYSIRMAKAGRYHIRLTVKDQNANTVGTAEWVTQAKEFSMPSIDPRSSVIPLGDE